MALLIAGRFNRFVEKLFNTKEGGSSLNSISPEIVINYTILSGVEDRYLQGWQRFSLDIQVAAVAAQFGVFQVRNQVGSGIVLVIESVMARTGAAAITEGILVKTTSTDFTVFSSQGRMDARSSPAPSAVTSNGTTATSPATNQLANAQASVPANATWQFITSPGQEWTVLPGDAFLTWNTTANSALAASIGWRERVLESSELS